MALPNPLYRGLLNIRMTTPHYTSHTFAARWCSLADGNHPFVPPEQTFAWPPASYSLLGASPAI